MSDLYPKQYVYEVVDATDDERYYALGIFLTESEALSVLDDKEPPCDDDGQDAITVEVRRRLVGFHPHESRKIASVTWVRDFESDEDKWTAQPIILTP